MKVIWRAVGKFVIYTKIPSFLLEINARKSIYLFIHTSGESRYC